MSLELCDINEKDGFSKKVANHETSIALPFMYCNFVKIHKTLKCAPAMAVGVTPKLWEMTDVVAMIKAEEAKVSKVRGPYKKRVK